MEGKGAWRDNVFVGRLWKSVKYEEVYLRAYASVSEARASIGRISRLLQQPEASSAAGPADTRPSLLQRAAANPGGGITKAENHLAEAPKLQMNRASSLKYCAVPADNHCHMQFD